MGQTKRTPNYTCPFMTYSMRAGQLIYLYLQRFYSEFHTRYDKATDHGYRIAWSLPRISCHDFVDNQVRLQLFALAYNLGNFLRRLALPRKVKRWSLITLPEKRAKIGTKVVTHCGYATFQMAKVAVLRDLFRASLERIGRLWCASGYRYGIRKV